MRNASVLGVYVGAYSPEQRRGAQQELLALYQRDLIRPVPTEIVSFADLPAAVGRVGRSEVSGKIGVAVE